MTAHRDLKRIIRERQSKTGESYTTARVNVMRERAALLGLVAPEPIAEEPLCVDAAVLKINRQSARVRVSGESGELTFRSRDVWDIVPGYLVTLVIEKRWTWKGDDYASGLIENPRIASGAWDNFRTPDRYLNASCRSIQTTIRVCDSVGTMFAAAEAGTKCRSARPIMLEAQR